MGYFLDNQNRVIGNDDAQDFKIHTNALERVKIESGGNVGIGKTPASKLDVNGQVEMTAFKLSTTPTLGHALIADAAGVGTWQTIPASGESNTASNVGVGGIGTFKQKTGVNLEFRNINAGSTKITATLDAGNNEIDIDVAEANFVIPNITQITTRSHASLQNLTADDHTQYALLAGRSGGQTIFGSTISGQDLTLKSNTSVDGLVRIHGRTSVIGGILAVGDMDYNIQFLKRQTPGSGELELFWDIDGASRIVLSDNSAYLFEATITGKQSGGTAVNGYRLEGIIKRGTGVASTAFVGSPSKTIFGEDDAAADVRASADTTNGALGIFATGVAAHAINWITAVKMTRIIGVA